MRGTTYQYSLISLGAVALLLFGVFFYREMFPEYRIYQNDYVALEQIRSTYTHEPPPAFKPGIKQILIERSDKGNPTIDRCISCHVALEFPHFSPTKIDPAAGLDSNGFPIKVKNEDYIWDKPEAQTLKSESQYDLTKVLAMHPLMGKETRPFEFHPIEEYGCSSCHSGNGRGITTLTAHGPFLDGQYEKEDMGETPLFTEVDPENDPRFSKIFNGKPGHALLFQTTPILVGNLIQSKCMQCHLSSPKALANAIEVIDHIAPEMQLNDLQAKQSDIDLLTKNYHRGEELFVEQGCYACHRISGFTRGGVGPELTQVGESYPWYVKESVVWPQADLHTSTMPNFVLDHEELEDVVTFLLGQTGKNQAVSQTFHKNATQQWEAGQKSALEKPISPVQMQDTRYAMTVFATEGCASCHRLTGFDSNVGFKIEKSNSAFAALQEEKEWFTRLIPEQIRGSTLVKVVEAHADEIDAHLADNVRTDGLLEEIEKTHPRLIETFYTPFKFAARAKKDAAWKKRIHDLLFIYVQEYGLGRLIGPRPNWSGIFRSDEWLMEHFKNPSSHVPRSIMPVFPFDETKFYALTLMLEKIAKKNRDATRTLWQNQGFNPETAYNLYCSQCHGDFLQGNGPVAPWIYPIPKNLNNAEFLRNLTRERVIDSIKHGIKGTPMPPWGEGSGPVMTDSEIESMTNWLFSMLPGGQVIRSTHDVLKWNYNPADVLKELQKEGDKKTDLFDAIANSTSHTDPQSYYIKKEYYTPENLDQGQQFFEMNCAVCHGKDADGSGLRSSTMDEAKPRMLTNVDWIKTRDDLRLLRSIKFGVPGTSMSPWGDLTSSLQRVQLVMFIRSLSEERTQREELDSMLFKTFDKTQFEIEKARKTYYASLLEAKKAYKEIQPKLKTLDKEELFALLQKESSLKKTIEQLTERDEAYLKLKSLLKEEEKLYHSVGLALIQTKDTALLRQYLVMLSKRHQEQELSKATATLIESISDKPLKDKLTSTAAETAKLRTQQQSIIQSES